MSRLLSREPELEGLASRLAGSDRAENLDVEPASKKNPRQRARSRVGGVPRQDRGAARTNGRLAGPRSPWGVPRSSRRQKLLWSSVPASDSPRPRPSPRPAGPAVSPTYHWHQLFPNRERPAAVAGRFSFLSPKEFASQGFTIWKVS